MGRSLRLLPGSHIVVSFADPDHGHVGYVYQATNFLYCGLSEKRTDWAIKGQEGLHGHTVADQFRGCESRANAIREKYGDDFYLQARTRKHRYVSFVGPKCFKRSACKALRYPVEPYPKAAANGG